MTAPVLVLAWFFTVTTPMVSMPLIVSRPYATEQECNGARIAQLHMQLENGWYYNIEECKTKMVDPREFEAMRGLPQTP